MIWWDRHVQIPADEPPPPAPVRQPSDEDMEMDRERDISRSRKKRDRGTDEALWQGRLSPRKARRTHLLRAFCWVRAETGRAALLRRKARRGSAIDALIVAFAEPDGTVLTSYVAAAAQRGIAITPAAAFTVGSGHAPNAVRLALGSLALNVLTPALQTLADLAREKPSVWNTE